MSRALRIPRWHPGPASPKPPDYGTERGAALLAEKIAAAWQAEGHKDVHAWVAPGPHIDGHNIGRFIVKTNLVNGLPPR